MSKLLPSHLAAVLMATALCAAPAGARTKHHPRPCRPADSTLAAHDRDTRLYRIDDTQQRWYGCLSKYGKRRLLATIDTDCVHQCEKITKPVALDGHVAWIHSQSFSYGAGTDSYNTAASELIFLRTGKRMRYPAPENTQTLPDGSTNRSSSVSALALGCRANVLDLVASPTGPGSVLRLHSIDQPDRELDQGTIDPASVRFAGMAANWTKDGVAQSVPLVCPAG